MKSTDWQSSKFNRLAEFHIFMKSTNSIYLWNQQIGRVPSSKGLSRAGKKIYYTQGFHIKNDITTNVFSRISMKTSMQGVLSNLQKIGWSKFHGLNPRFYISWSKHSEISSETLWI
jgi:hypothetical protein